MLCFCGSLPRRCGERAKSTKKKEVSMMTSVREQKKQGWRLRKKKKGKASRVKSKNSQSKRPSLPPAKLAPARPRSLYPRHQKKMQTSLCRSANLACAARPSKAAGARIAAPAARRSSSVVVRAEGEAPAKWAPPALDANTPSPTFGGSTGGLLRKAQVRSLGREKPRKAPRRGQQWDRKK